MNANFAEKLRLAFRIILSDNVQQVSTNLGIIIYATRCRVYSVLVHFSSKMLLLLLLLLLLLFVVVVVVPPAAATVAVHNTVTNPHVIAFLLSIKENRYNIG